MTDFTSISIIYNPNSTGSGAQLAKELKATLKKVSSIPNITLIKTEYAGHAEEIAYKLAKKSKKPLVISASGDGGYHEVINGLLRAQKEGAAPIAGLLPAGNANDHYTVLHDQDTDIAIQKQKIRTIDMLHLSTTVDGETFERYAHSYIGIGLTPKVGQELNKTDLHRLNEAWIVLKSLLFLQPVKIRIGNKRRSVDSIICSNVSKMSKVLNISKDASMRDGKFEATVFHRRNKLQLFMLLFRATTLGVKNARQTELYEFTTIKEVAVQLDGEIFTIDAGSEVTISIEKQLLHCII